jgi:hypothetical protein
MYGHEVHSSIRQILPLKINHMEKTYINTCMSLEALNITQLEQGL